MSCPYYWWNNHYACRKSEKDVNSDLYDKFCSTYDYSDCPIYKGGDSSGCFLTSACTEARGLPDDCRELTVLRAFRDGYMCKLAGREAEIQEYYRIAPVIVEKIRDKENSEEIFDLIYTELVLPCVELIDAGKNENAHKLYREYVEKLKAEYI